MKADLRRTPGGRGSHSPPWRAVCTLRPPERAMAAADSSRSLALLLCCCCWLLRGPLLTRSPPIGVGKWTRRGRPRPPSRKQADRPCVPPPPPSAQANTLQMPLGLSRAREGRYLLRACAGGHASSAPCRALCRSRRRRERIRAARRAGVERRTRRCRRIRCS